MSWKHWIELIGDGIIIWFGAWSILTFYLIVRYGAAYFVEPNLWILYIEGVLAVLALAIGFERLIDDILELRKLK